MAPLVEENMHTEFGEVEFPLDLTRIWSCKLRPCKHKSAQPLTWVILVRKIRKTLLSLMLCLGQSKWTIDYLNLSISNPLHRRLHGQKEWVCTIGGCMCGMLMCAQMWGTYMIFYSCITIYLLCILAGIFYPCREDYLYLLPVRFYLWVCVWICHMCAGDIPSRAKREGWIPCWNYRWLWATGLKFLEANLGYLEEQQELLKPESPFHLLIAFL